MDNLTLKQKKKPITYGKSVRKQGYGRPVDLDSEDELATMDKQLSGRLSKPISQRPIKPNSKILPSPKLTTPPVSPSPSITSPSSSVGTKRASPFLDGSSGEQKKRARLMSAASSSSLEDMFPVAEEKKRKPVPKLHNKAVLESPVSISDETQILLDKQLQETPIPPVIEKPAVGKKSSGLKMPTRIRGPTSSMQSPQKVVDGTKPTDEIAKPIRRNSVKVKQALPVAKAGQDLDQATFADSRPRTPDKARIKKITESVVSPSNLELDDLRISNRMPAVKTPDAKLSVPFMEASPKPSPSRPKLKDRLTSDLDDMVIELNTSTAEAFIASPRSEKTRKTSNTPPERDVNETEDPQRSSIHANNQPSQTQGPKITYGAARWTFLPDDDEDMALLDPILDHRDSNGQGKKSRQLPSLAKSTSNLGAFDMDEDDEDEEPTTTMRSLHELKRAGGSQHLNRQIEALLDDTENSSTKSQRITALVEIVTKLKQTSFLRQFLDAGSEARLLSLMNTMSDTITKILYSTALLLVLNSPNFSTMSVEAETLRLSAFFGKLLGQKGELTSLIKSRNNHVPRDSQKTIEKLYSSLRTSTIWSSQRPSSLTPQILGLTCLERLVRKLRESGHRAELLSAHTVDSLVESLLDWHPHADNNTILIASLSLSTLESASLVYSISSDVSEETSWSQQTGAQFISFCTRILDPLSIATHGELVSLVLRLCLNLSNGNAKTCTIFCNINFIGSILQTTTTLFSQLSSSDSAVNQDLVLDNLVLSLGLLINLSEKLNQARDLFLEGDTLDKTPLGVLLQLFTSRLQEAFEVTSEAEIRSNVPFGYLAVLLGYLCRTPAIFSQVRSQLEGGNLRLLLIAIGEFSQYHQKVDELRSADEETDVNISFITRLQGLVDELRIKDSSIAPK